MIGPLVFCILMYSIYSQVQQQSGWNASFSKLLQLFSGRSLVSLTACFLLMFVNWGLEARKWQVAMQAVEPVTFGRSLKAIFSGATMAFFTPNRIGEYLGRVLYVTNRARLSSVALTIMCGTAQLLITLWVGFAGLLYLRPLLADSHTGYPGFWIDLLLYIVLAGSLFLMVFYFRLSWIVSRINRLGIQGRISRYLALLGNFNTTMLLRILSISFARYLVFIVQYYLLFRVFGVELNWWQTFWSMSVVFLVLAIVPSIAIFTDLGIRWKASMELIALFSSNAIGILATSLTIWLINLVLPAVIGSLLIFTIRIFRPGTEDYLRDVKQPGK